MSASWDFREYDQKRLETIVMLREGVTKAVVESQVFRLWVSAT